MSEKEFIRLIEKAFTGDREAVEKYLRLTATEKQTEDKSVMEVIDEIVSEIE
ncbi:hypothetical protein OB976_05820 [Bacillus cereus]|nr:hypothetical protein [Bacillus cereus]